MTRRGRTQVADRKKALFKWRNAELVHTWRALKDITSVTRDNRRLLARVRARLHARKEAGALVLWRQAAEDWRWAQHLVVHTLWAYEVRVFARVYLSVCLSIYLSIDRSIDRSIDLYIDR